MRSHSLRYLRNLTYIPPKAHSRFSRFNGQHGARLTQRQRVREERQTKSTLASWAVSLFLFKSTDGRLSQLKEIWVDGVLSKVPWATFANNTVQEWEQVVINVCLIILRMWNYTLIHSAISCVFEQAAVLLNANMAFMSIPGVVNEPQTANTPLTTVPPVQFFSQISTIVSLGSMGVGLLLLRQYRSSRTIAAASDIVSRQY